MVRQTAAHQRPAAAAAAAGVASLHTRQPPYQPCSCLSQQAPPETVHSSPHKTHIHTFTDIHQGKKGRPPACRGALLSSDPLEGDACGLPRSPHVTHVAHKAPTWPPSGRRHVHTPAACCSCCICSQTPPSPHPTSITGEAACVGVGESFRSGFGLETLHPEPSFTTRKASGTPPGAASHLCSTCLHCCAHQLTLPQHPTSLHSYTLPPLSLLRASTAAEAPDDHQGGGMPMPCLLPPPLSFRSSHTQPTPAAVCVWGGGGGYAPLLTPPTAAGGMPISCLSIYAHVHVARGDGQQQEQEGEQDGHHTNDSQGVLQ